MSVFLRLREEHFEKLLPKIRAGDHAVLLQLWEMKLQNSSEESPAAFIHGSTSGSDCGSSSRGSSPRVGPLLPPRFSPPASQRVSPPYQRYNTKPSTSASAKSFKELSEFYKAKALQRVNANKPKKEKEVSQMMIIILGGMVFDQILGRGVRKRYLHEPNPTRVEMKRESSYDDVLKMATSLFFEVYNPELDSLSLADSTGMPINVASRENWTLGAFYHNNGLQPSRYKLYVVIQASIQGEEPTVVEEPQSRNSDLVKGQELSTTRTEPVVKQCVTCNRDFRTYIPQTTCCLPDGGSIFYSTPQDKCPLCDINQFGAFMNEDLFPELSK